ncbi:MAG: cytochrome c3 family protein [Pyrinomonadaceae bacterium]
MRPNAVTAKPTVPRRRPAVERLSLVIVAATALACVWLMTGGRVIAIAPAAPAPVVQEQDYSKFLHNDPKHAAIACASCHKRASDNSISPAYDGRASLPGHKACTDCHLAQFVQQNTAMCSICHTSVENNAHPPVKNFPGLMSFNAKFDHAQHNIGDARPPAGCASCHTAGGRRAAAMSIPATLNAHAQCYTCHTPNAQANGREISSCGVCHALGSYARTPVAGRSFAVGFSHLTHGRRQGLGCNDCHNLRAGAPQRQQVTSTRPLQHFGSGRAQSCMTCHNGRRAFGDENFNECVKCHKGTTFRM